MKATIKKKKPPLRKKRRATDDMREACITKVNRLIFRLDRVNRRFFRGANEDISQAATRLTSVVEHVRTLPASWKPRAKGKNALIPGMKIRIKDGLERKELVTINHLGGAPRYYGARIVAESDHGMFIVLLQDGVKTLVPRRHVEAVTEGGPVPIVIDDSPLPEPPKDEPAVPDAPPLANNGES